MSKITLSILFAAIALIVVATVFNATFVAGGAGVVLTVGLIYAFVVTKRDIERGDNAAADAIASSD